MQWLLILEIIIYTTSGPVVHISATEAESKVTCERAGEHIRSELAQDIAFYDDRSSVTTSCILKSQRVL